MDYYFLIAGFIIFLCVIGVYLYSCIVKLKQEPDLGDGVSIFLSCNGIAVGVKVAYLGLLAQSGLLTQSELLVQSLKMSANDRIYILLGGLAVIWVSIQTILKIIGNCYKEQANMNENDL